MFVEQVEEMLHLNKKNPIRILDVVNLAVGMSCSFAWLPLKRRQSGLALHLYDSKLAGLHRQLRSIVPLGTRYVSYILTIRSLASYAFVGSSWQHSISSTVFSHAADRAGKYFAC